MRIRVFFVGLLILLSIILLTYRSGDAFDLSKGEQKNLMDEALRGNCGAAYKLYLYYNYTKNDYNKTMYILRVGSEYNDPKLQRILAFYLLRKDIYHPYEINQSKQEEGLYWLKKSASQGDKEARQFLKELRSTGVK